MTPSPLDPHGVSAPASDGALVLANRIPYPLDDGWKVRTFHVLREIARRMPVTLVVFEGSEKDGRAEGLRDALGQPIEIVGVPLPKQYSSWRLAMGLLGRWPIHVWNNRSADLDRTLRSVVAERRPTVGVAVCVWMFPQMARLDSVGVRIVDTHNVDSDLMRRYVPHVQGFVRRLYARLTARKLEALERHSFREVDRVWVCSQDEADLLERRGWEAAVRVIPNGVDVAHFAAYEGDVVRNRLLFFGKLDYFPNVDALHFLVEEIVPRLRGRVDFEIKVIGAGKTDGIADACAACPELELVGRVDDVRSWLATAGLVVVPLRMGSGTRLKILEAMAAGRPILSTTIGAEGIAADSGRHILRADSAEDFADEIVRVLPDHALGDSIGAEGQGLVRSRYDWLAIGTAIERELEESLGARDAL